VQPILIDAGAIVPA
jgi:hypothetical protein